MNDNKATLAFAVNDLHTIARRLNDEIVALGRGEIDNEISAYKMLHLWDKLVEIELTLETLL